MFMSICDKSPLLDGGEQLGLFYKFGMDKDSGLPYHGYELKKSEQAAGYLSDKKGILSWGRAFGWLIMGACANAAYGNPDEKNLAEFKKLCEAALKYQRKDGGWSWQLQAVDGHIDMSATGMIAYSLAVGAQKGVLQASSVKDALDKAAACMSEHIKNGDVQDALSSCDDFAVHYQTYGSYPWGQGAVLAALSMIKMANK